jgi:hypothetical protein
MTAVPLRSGHYRELLGRPARRARALEPVTHHLQ